MHIPAAALTEAAHHAGRLLIKTVMPTDGIWRRAVMLRWRDGRGDHEEILMFLED